MSQAAPPPLPHTSPILKIPLHHPTLLPVPRVPVSSQVCQLAVVMTPAAAICTNHYLYREFCLLQGHGVALAVLNTRSQQPPAQLLHNPYAPQLA